MWSTADLSSALGIDAPIINTATGVSIDTRTLHKGDLFIAISGPTFNANTFAVQALEKGAAAAVISDATYATDPRCIVVEDTTIALKQLATYARARFTTPVVGITGSIGKTTAKEMLKLALGAYATKGNLNNHYGVPLTLANMPKNADAAIIEMGMSHPNEIAPLSTLTQPDIALITTIAPAHIEAFESLEGIAREKSSIVAGVKQGGTIIIPAHQPVIQDYITAHRPDVTTKEFSIENVAYTENCGITCTSGTHTITIDVPSYAAAYNGAAALAISLELGHSPKTILARLKRWKPTAGRGLVHSLANNIQLIDDSYNASPTAVAASLEMLHHIPTTGRKIAILGDMLELGHNATHYHTNLAASLQGIDGVYCVGAEMQHLYKTLPPSQQLGAALTVEDLPSIDLRPYDIVLVKGSAGINLKSLVATLTA